MIRVLGREGERQGAWIGEPDVLGGDADQAPRDVEGILPPRQHAREPVERALDVRAPHRLVECRDEVEVLLAGFVVRGERFLEHGDDDVTGRGMRDTSCVDVLEDGFQTVEDSPRVALGILHERVYTVVIHASCIPHLTSRLRERSLDHGPDVVGGEGFEHEHTAPRQQRRRQLEAGILSCGTDQRDDATFDPRQERVLLSPVEPVDLVAEQDRPPPLVLESFLRLLDDLAHAPNALGDRGKRLELAVGVVRDQPGEGRLPRARWSPEDARAHVPSSDQIAQRLSGPEQMLLPEKVLEALRAHARREGLGRPGEQRRVRHRRS